MPVFLTVGCEDRSAIPPYVVILGSVQSVRHEEGEILFRVRDMREDREMDQFLICAISKDMAEIYIEDKLSSLSDLRPGDQLELIGHYDGSAPSERFVIATAVVLESASIGTETRPSGAPDTETPQSP